MLGSLFNKIAMLKACNFIKKRVQHGCFPVKFPKFLRTPILKSICKGLLLTGVIEAEQRHSLAQNRNLVLNLS